MIELKEIQRRRRYLNLTQSELARLSGISQSALAKIESGRMSPSYEIAKKIFDSLEQMEHREAVKASDIMTRRIITIDANEKVETAIELLKKHGISQIPVVLRRAIIGLFSEATLLERVGEKNLAHKKVSDVMGESPPQVSETTPVKSISELLRFCPIVVITKNGSPTGVIAKADLLKVVK